MKLYISRLTLTAAALAAFVQLASATVYFSNTGVNAGWSGSAINGGNIAEVTNVKYKGSKSLRHIVKYPAYRAEKTKSGMGQRGQTRYYGFAMQLPNNWENMPNQGVDISQIIANYNSNCPGSQSEFAPSFFFQLKGSSFKSVVYTGSNPCTGSVPATTNTLRSSIKGSWVRVIYRATWKSDSSGRNEVWINGTRHLNRTGKNTFPYTQPFAFRTGIYIPQWKNGNFTTSQKEKKIWLDHTRVASSKNEADPTKW